MHFFSSELIREEELMDQVEIVEIEEPQESTACSLGDHGYCRSSWCECLVCHARRFVDEDQDRRSAD